MKLIALSAPSERTGMFLGYYGSLFSLGGILAYLLIPPLIKFRWEWTYATTVGMNLFLILWLWALRLEKVTRIANPLPLVRVLRLREGWVLGAYHALAWGAMINLGSWLPSLLADAWKGSATDPIRMGRRLGDADQRTGTLIGELYPVEGYSLESGEWIHLDPFIHPSLSLYHALLRADIHAGPIGRLVCLRQFWGFFRSRFPVGSF